MIISRSLLFLMLIFILCCTLVISCGDDGESSDNGDNSSDDDDIASDDDDNDDSEPDAISSATPGVNSTMLSASHAGWKKADCMSCHQDAHNNGFENPECHTCHGNNGAPRRTAGHDNSDCFSCHTTQHPEAEFQSPSDCRMCHGYEIDQSAGCPTTESFDVVVIGAGGRIVAELLTDDEQMQALIIRQPALNWKAMNVRKHFGLD